MSVVPCMFDSFMLLCVELHTDILDAGGIFDNMCASNPHTNINKSHKKIKTCTIQAERFCVCVAKGCNKTIRIYFSNTYNTLVERSKNALVYSRIVFTGVYFQYISVNCVNGARANQIFTVYSYSFIRNCIKLLPFDYCVLGIVYRITALWMFLISNCKYTQDITAFRFCCVFLFLVRLCTGIFEISGHVPNQTDQFDKAKLFGLNVAFSMAFNFISTSECCICDSNIMICLCVCLSKIVLNIFQFIIHKWNICRIISNRFVFLTIFRQHQLNSKCEAAVKMWISC